MGHVDTGKPAAEVLVEGELSPFEPEALYRLLEKHLYLERPSCCEDIPELAVSCDCQRRPISASETFWSFFRSDTLTTRRIGGSRRQNMEAKQGLALAQGRLF
jgi:hypothetical protein